MIPFLTKERASLPRLQQSGSLTGFTLVEIMVAVGLFAVIMLLASGAYLMMIALNQQAQNITTGIDNLSFALETMTRNIRTGSQYSCGGLGGDCPSGSTSITFLNPQGVSVTYGMSGSSLIQTVGGTQSLLTDSSVTITSFTVYVFGSRTTVQADYEQAHVSLSISGTVSAGPGKPTQSFTIETGATMRGSDL